MAGAQGVRAPAGRCHDDGLAAQICQPRVRARLLLVGGHDRTRHVAAAAAERLQVALTEHDDVAVAVADLSRARASCVLLDAPVAAPDALAALTRLSDARQDVPIIVVGTDIESPLAVAAVQAGAQDYVVRDEANDRSLERVIRHAIDRKRVEVQLARLALHDDLTGLPNRSLFDDRLDAALRRRRAGRGVAVLFIDIDSFKRINDSLGHGAGDAVLRETAARLRAAVRPGDTVARLGGDEFTVLCEDIGDECDALRIADRVAADLGRPLHLDGEEIVLRASIGVAVARDDDVSAEEVLRRSDAAMYAAKAAGNGRPQVHAPGDVRPRPGLDLHVEAALRRAIPRELVAWYQPVVAIEDARIVGVEALVRWQHPERGLVPPGEFIPVAEESGLIVALGAWMLEEACRQSVSWGGTRVSVNVSGRQVAEGSLPAAVRAALEATGLPPHRLQLELTETVLMDDVDRHAEVLRELKALGVSLALDDFGKGYSSLNYLHRFPFDRIKVDRSFIARLPESRADRAIVAAVTSFASALEMEVVAEGVETEEQLDALRSLGCEYAQGFLFHRPMPAAAIDQLLVAPRG
jgi:diguanylate cyclase (GGDEF)-like protein